MITRFSIYKNKKFIEKTNDDLWALAMLEWGYDVYDNLTGRWYYA